MKSLESINTKYTAVFLLILNIVVVVVWPPSQSRTLTVGDVDRLNEKYDSWIQLSDTTASNGESASINERACVSIDGIRTERELLRIRAEVEKIHDIGFSSKETINKYSFIWVRGGKQIRATNRGTQNHTHGVLLDENMISYGVFETLDEVERVTAKLLLSGLSTDEILIDHYSLNAHQYQISVQFNHEEKAVVMKRVRAATAGLESITVFFAEEIGVCS